MLQLQLMKKLLVTIFLQFFSFVFSQDYQFDYMLKANVVRENPQFTIESYDMMNSKNHSYYMEVYKDKNAYRSFLIDNQIKIVHRFRELHFSANPMSFKYKNSNALSDYSYYNLSKFKIEKIGELTYKVTPEKILNPKEEHLEIEVKLEPFEDDLLVINFDLLSYSQRLEIENLIKEKLKSENLIGKYFIKEIIYKYKKNSTWTEKITPIRIDNHLILKNIKLNLVK